MEPTGEWLNQPGGIAERLWRLRNAAGLTGRALAAQLGWPRSKVPKLENGRQMPTREDVTAWAQACGDPEAVPELLDLLNAAQVVHRQYRHARRRGQAVLQEEMDRAVRQATRVRSVEVTLIPGLLQTADYARSRCMEAVTVYGFAADGVEPAVAARMHRQEALYDSGRAFEFVITEAALRFGLCPPAAMAGQIDRLSALAGLGNITLGIVPLDVELPVAPLHGFLLAGGVAYLETHAALIDVRGEEVAAYDAAADALMAEAVTGDGASRLLAAAAVRLRDREGGDSPAGKGLGSN